MSDTSASLHFLIANNVYRLLIRLEELRGNLAKQREVYKSQSINTKNMRTLNSES